VSSATPVEAKPDPPPPPFATRLAMPRALDMSSNSDITLVDDDEIPSGRGG